MTLSAEIDVAAMQAMRAAGSSIDEIAAKAGIKPMTAYQRLRRAYGPARNDTRSATAARTKLPGPDNDNNPHRVTRMSARNGGCSTTSGMMPVTLVRLACIDGVAA